MIAGPRWAVPAALLCIQGRLPGPDWAGLGRRGGPGPDSRAGLGRVGPFRRRPGTLWQLAQSVPGRIQGRIGPRWAVPAALLCIQGRIRHIAGPDWAALGRIGPPRRPWAVIAGPRWANGTALGRQSGPDWANGTALLCNQGRIQGRIGPDWAVPAALGRISRAGLGRRGGPAMHSGPDSGPRWAGLGRRNGPGPAIRAA